MKSKKNRLKGKPAGEREKKQDFNWLEKITLVSARESASGSKEYYYCGTMTARHGDCA